MQDELEQLRAERDFYAGLLGLGREDDPAQFLERAAHLALRTLGADRAYLALFHEDGHSLPTFWTASGFSSEELDVVRAAISEGIVAEALATGRVIQTHSARVDPRFRDRGSVQKNRIEAVLCVPLGEGPPLGVLYLQGAKGGSFSEPHEAKARFFAANIAPLAERLLTRERTPGSSGTRDATAPLRARFDFSELVGRSAALARLLEQLSSVAPLNVDVLLTGPTGSGKTAAARSLWKNGPRRTKPFVELNCAALPEALVESELFGAAAGAHSTAVRALPGKLQAAEGGTLFLDEVAELSLTAQAKLLQFLHSREYYPLGVTQPVRADVRIIAATNSDLRRAVAERKFREDLLYRLEVMPIRVPGLDERTSDIEAIAGALVESASHRHGLPALRLSSSARRALTTNSWPGHVRQLAHVVEAALIRAAGGGASTIEAEHVFPRHSSAPELQAELTFQAATRQFQREFLSRALAARNWNVSLTARDLDIARSHLYDLIRVFGIGR